PRRRHVLRRGNVIEQIQPCIQISRVAVKAVEPEEHDRQLRVPRQAQVAREELPVFADLRYQVALGTVDRDNALGGATNGREIGFASRDAVDLDEPLQHVGDAMSVSIPARLKDVVMEKAVSGLLRYRPVGIGESNILISLLAEKPT